MMPINMKLKRLMDTHSLRDEHVAILLSVSAFSVAMWRKGKRPMPANLLELLAMKLQAGPGQEKEND